MATKKVPLIGTFIESETRQLKRTLTFVLKQQVEDNENDAKFTKAKINYKLSDINFNVRTKLLAISGIFKIPIKVEISQSNPPVPVFVNNIEDVIHVITDSEDLRIIIKFEDYDVNALKDVIITKNISHVVEVNIVDNIFGRQPTEDLNIEDLSCATIYPTSIESIYRIIEDVMLDIAMYHSMVMPFLSSDANLKKELSYLKVCYAQKEKLLSDNWNINRNKGYISLAGYFRNKTGFDYWGYVACWGTILMDVRKISPNSFSETQISIEDQLKKHPLYKQLPIKKICTLYKALDKGNYILITTTKKPNNDKSRRAVLNNFKGYKGGSTVRWTRTKVNIIGFERIGKLKDYLNWINIFQIFK